MSKFIDADKDGVDDNQDVKQGLSNFGQMRDEFFSKADKEETGRSGLQMGLVADQIGKQMDSATAKDMANFQSGMYKDNSKFGALDKQFNLQDEFQNRQFGRNIGMEQAEGEQRRKDLKETGAQARETYDFQDTVDARGEERDRGRANRLARSF